MRRVFVRFCALSGFCLLAGIATAGEQFHSVGPGTAIPRTDGTRDLPCGFGNLTMNSDQTYENAYAWSYCANQRPD